MDPPVCEKIIVLTPITSPSRFISGPPEFPLLIGASVWMKLSYGPERISLPTAEIIPAVTLPPSPRGLPIAITHSPTFDFLLSPKVIKGRSLFVSILRSAKSILESRPITSATNVSSLLSVTFTVVAPSTTWLLVTI